MAKQQKNPVQTHFLVKGDYLMTRGAALHFPAKEFSSMIRSDSTVYGAVIDIPLDPVRLMTAVVYINGAANLYFNNGRDYTGEAARYPRVLEAARMVIANGPRILGQCEKTTCFDLPTGREHHIFLLTRTGVYKTVMMPSQLAQADADMRAFCILYQRLMSELMAAQKEDRAIQNAQKA